MENKSEARNHRKIGDARRKTKNKGPTARMGVKTCTGTNKMQKATTKTKSALKTECIKM